MANLDTDATSWLNDPALAQQVLARGGALERGLAVRGYRLAGQELVELECHGSATRILLQAFKGSGAGAARQFVFEQEVTLRQAPANGDGAKGAVVQYGWRLRAPYDIAPAAQALSQGVTPDQPNAPLAQGESARPVANDAQGHPDVLAALQEAMGATGYVLSILHLVRELVTLADARVVCDAVRAMMTTPQGQAPLCDLLAEFDSRLPALGLVRGTQTEVTGPCTNLTKEGVGEVTFLLSYPLQELDEPGSAARPVWCVAVGYTARWTQASGQLQLAVKLDLGLAGKPLSWEHVPLALGLGNLQDEQRTLAWLATLDVQAPLIGRVMDRRLRDMLEMLAP